MSVCVTPPGFDSDVKVHSDLACFYRLWLGHTGYDAAIRIRIPSSSKDSRRWCDSASALADVDPMAGLVRERSPQVAQPA